MSASKRVLALLLFSAAAAVVFATPAFSASGRVSAKIAFVSLWGRVRRVGPFSYEIRGAGSESGSVTLPHTFSGLPPRTPVVLTAELNTRTGDSLLIKAFYSPLRVYVDDVLLYECGQDDSYPSFMRDPPTTMAIRPLPRNAQRLRLEYLSPAGRGRLEAQSVLIGNDMALYTDLLIENLPSLVFSALLIFSGVMVIFLTIFLLRGLPRANTLPWLGLFSISVGVWGLGECDFTLFLIPYPVALHMMAFVGLFAITVPFLTYGIRILDPAYPLPLRMLQRASCASLLTALVLQLSGVMDLSQDFVLTWFHIWTPFAFTAFSGCLAWEYRNTGNRNARRFAIPILLLAFFSALEAVNYRWRFTNLLSLSFQTGVMVFIFSLGIVGGHYLRDSLKIAREKEKLEADMTIISRSLEAQREQYAALMANNEQAAAYRHDLRHHLAVIRQYSTNRDLERLNAYLDRMIGGIPQSPKVVCQNSAVNAVTQHYLSAARDEGVSLDVFLDVPKSAGHVSDMDLCVIVGNFLENALEACRRVKDGERRIRARARVRKDTLTITVENSFDGVYREKGGEYLSRKRLSPGNNIHGVGISSVRAICEKYNGSTRFDIEGNVWRASALVDMTGHLEGEDA